MLETENFRPDTDGGRLDAWGKRSSFDQLLRWFCPPLLGIEQPPQQKGRWMELSGMSSNAKHRVMSNDVYHLNATRHQLMVNDVALWRKLHVFSLHCRSHYVVCIFCIYSNNRVRHSLIYLSISPTCHNIWTCNTRALPHSSRGSPERRPPRFFRLETPGHLGKRRLRRSLRWTGHPTRPTSR